MQPAGKNILPIFNKKKRPRQAVFTFPQKTTESNGAIGRSQFIDTSRSGGPSQSFQSINTQKQSQTSGYMAPNQQQKNMAPNQQKKNPQQFNRAPGFKNNANRNTTTSSTVNNNRSSFSAQPSGASGSTSQPGFLGQVRKPPNKHGPMPRQPQQYQQQQQQHRPQQQTNQIRNNQSQYGSRNNGKENYQQYNRSTPQQQSNQFNIKSSHTASTYPNPATQTTSHTASTYPNPATQTTTNKRPYTPSNATQSRPPPTGSGPSTYTSQQYTPRNMQMSNPSTSFSKPAVFLPFQGPGSSGTEEAPTIPATLTPADKTLKILTSNIEGMKHWSQYTDFVGLLLCEMFGILNSAITTGESATSKLFTLKDGAQTQKCVFYETDRKIPRLTRGQCLRCVGSLHKKSGLFRVVTVRPASQQEQAMSKAIIAKCDQAISDRLAEMQEQ